MLQISPLIVCSCRDRTVRIWQVKGSLDDGLYWLTTWLWNWEYYLHNSRTLRLFGCLFCFLSVCCFPHSVKCEHIQGVCRLCVCRNIYHIACVLLYLTEKRADQHTSKSALLLSTAKRSSMDLGHMLVVQKPKLGFGAVSVVKLVETYWDALRSY